ncbi:MAG: hypothetical protein IT163_13645 [Bryobacterales bacterium]|nr:hypothetical protein [Bryobacterales bacterium]
MHRICLLPFAALLCAAPPPAGRLNGGAVFPGSRDTAAWGTGVFLNGKPVQSGWFGRGGCVADWNRDQRPDLILNELDPGAPDGSTGRMVALLAPLWQRELIDTGASFRDCLDTTLHGRPGLLATHLQTQLRFYERTASGKPAYREVYSIYTPSAQSGLVRADVDGDGNPDILHGNYWLRAPARWEDGWRLFALNTWFYQPRSAMVRIVALPLGGRLAAVEAESEASPARFAWFALPANPRDEWIQHDIAVPGGLHHPQVLVQGDAPGTVVAGEDNGPGSRLLRINLTTGEVRELARSSGYLAAGPGGTPAVVRK